MWAYIRRKLGAQSVIPAKRGKKTWHIHGVRAEMRRSFPRRLYRRRALIESVFSSVKRKLSARAPGRSLRMQMRQALLLGLSFNLYRLRHRYLFLRMSTEPDGFRAVQTSTETSTEDKSMPGLAVPDLYVTCPYIQIYLQLVTGCVVDCTQIGLYSRLAKALPL